MMLPNLATSPVDKLRGVDVGAAAQHTTGRRSYRRSEVLMEVNVIGLKQTERKPGVHP